MAAPVPSLALYDSGHRAVIPVRRVYRLRQETEGAPGQIWAFWRKENSAPA